jgi:hypothetical protein
MIEKCASLALQFHEEMDAEDEMEEENDPVDHNNASDLNQEDPPDPQIPVMLPTMSTGGHRGDDGSE